MPKQKSGSGFTDKEVLQDALTSQKGVTGVLNTFSNECKCPRLRKTMMNILNDEHAIQFDIFNDMSARGYYPTTPAPQTKVEETKSKFSGQAQPASTTNTGQWHTEKATKRRGM